MGKDRLEAFTDGVMAIIITILVLEIPEPEGVTFGALWPLRFKLILYLLSFLTIAVYWNNHHHLFQISEKISGTVLWANNVFLLTISLLPIATAWAGTHIDNMAPEVTMGIVFFAVNLSFYLLVRTLLSAHDEDAAITTFFGSHYYKPWFSMITVFVGIFMGLIWPLLVAVLSFASLIPWIIPDHRVDHYLKHQD